MEPDDLLCSRNARLQKALARANGTFHRASGWAGEKVARSGRPNRPPSRREGQTSFEIKKRSLTLGSLKATG